MVKWSDGHGQSAWPLCKLCKLLRMLTKPRAFDPSFDLSLSETKTGSKRRPSPRLSSLSLVLALVSGPDLLGIMNTTSGRFFNRNGLTRYRSFFSVQRMRWVVTSAWQGRRLIDLHST
ncbi:hypothetical protein RRG08_033000 [Elysia crispata]|uniref:Uncharacterized protein n=1 Tax=Elysia crispata TaxID=231223 RepID=A0AAE0YSH7_9GAST|nr:hypothetical protein RRG08_033000 [Elysia crispata]